MVQHMNSRSKTTVKFAKYLPCENKSKFLCGSERREKYTADE